MSAHHLSLNLSPLSGSESSAVSPAGIDFVAVIGFAVLGLFVSAIYSSAGLLLLFE